MFRFNQRQSKPHRSGQADFCRLPKRRFKSEDYLVNIIDRVTVHKNPDTAEKMIQLFFVNSNLR